MIPTVRQPHWFLLANRSRPSTLNPNSISQNPKLKPINKRGNLPSRVHGARLDSNRVPLPAGIKPQTYQKRIAEECPKSAKNGGKYGCAAAGDPRGKSRELTSRLIRVGSARIWDSPRCEKRKRSREGRGGRIREEHPTPLGPCLVVAWKCFQERETML